MLDRWRRQNIMNAGRQERHRFYPMLKLNTILGASKILPILIGLHFYLEKKIGDRLMVVYLCFTAEKVETCG
ncbi:hypothetical protein BM1_06704 [Bipolaris maydis]|nr:hypothetical protein BM1_06704 [Bipolaris maydis]